MPFVNHPASGERFYVCDLSYEGNFCSASDETEHRVIEKQESPS